MHSIESPQPRSLITGGPTELLFSARVLNRFDVRYFRCCETGYIQTESPHWLDEAYSSAITSLDLGLASRNCNNVAVTSRIIDRSFPAGSRFLDFGGGYGMFTRLMRDRGYSFLHYDTHCENLFAQGCEVTDLKACSGDEFDLLTAWEVFEHLDEPRSTLSEMLNVSTAVLFSTELVPSAEIRSVDDWWYFLPEIGQHISFYTLDSFRYLANELNVHFYSDGSCQHILSKHELKSDPFPNPKLTTRLANYVARRFKRDAPARKSLLQDDFNRRLALLRDAGSGG